MDLKTRLDQLIEAAWRVIETDFDPVVFQQWRAHALACVTEMVGPDHYYTHCFREYVQDAREPPILAGRGILEAVKEQKTSGTSAVIDVAPQDQSLLLSLIHI